MSGTTIEIGGKAQREVHKREVRQALHDAEGMLPWVTKVQKVIAWAKATLATLDDPAATTIEAPPDMPEGDPRPKRRRR
jgi:hypothetical protein